MRAQQDAVIDALDRADVQMHQAVAELAERLTKIERARREAIMRALDAASAEGSTGDK